MWMATNITMLCVTLGILAYALLVWLDPTGARHLAKLLNRRANALEASREAYKRTMQWYRMREGENEHTNNSSPLL